MELYFHPNLTIYNATISQVNTNITNTTEYSINLFQRFGLYSSLLIAAIGIPLNLIVLFFVSNPAVRVSKIAKIYYLLTCVGDLTILLKIFIVALGQTACYLKAQDLCIVVGTSHILWKIIMGVWLTGEVISNYSIMQLNVFRLFSILFPKFVRSNMTIKCHLTTILVIIIPLLFYIWLFSPILYIIKPDNTTISKVIVDVDEGNSDSKHFRIISKIFIFAIPTCSGALLSSIILFHIKRKYNNRYRPPASVLSDQPPPRNIRHRCSRLRSSIVAVALSVINVIIYLTTIIFSVYRNISSIHIRLRSTQVEIHRSDLVFHDRHRTRAYFK